MKNKKIASALVLLLLVATPAQASIPIPIPSIPLLFFGSRGHSQSHVDPQENRFVEFWNEAVAAERNDDYQTAIQYWQRALSIHPENYEARSALAQAYRQAGMTVAAIALGRQLLGTRPKDESIWRLLINSYMDTNQLELAMSTAQEFMQRFPGSKNRKTVQIDIDNLQQELGDRSKAPSAVAATDDNYLPFACEEGVYRWPLEKMPLKVYIESGQGVSKWNEQFPNSVRKAFDKWQLATQGMVRFTEVTDEAAADIAVKWDDGTKDLGHSGHAGPDQLDDKGCIQHARITLHTQVPQMRSDVTPDTVCETAQHEIGHTLGLLGHSDRPDDIMYWSTTPNEHGISMRDVRTLVRLYAVDPSMIDANGKLVGYFPPSGGE